MSGTITWWEKTVEYAFIQRHVFLDSMIAPLDGDQERAGDAIFSADSRWIIIEFKRNEGSIADEKEKYRSYQSTKIELSSQDGHHLLVFGYESEGALELACQTYFSKQNVEISAFATQGISLNVFKQYLVRLLKHKKPAGSGSSSGFDSVVVVGKDKKGIRCLSFKEFGIALGITKKIDPPSFGLSM